MVVKSKLNKLIITLVNVYVALPVFTPVAGRSYAVNLVGIFIFDGVNTIKKKMPHAKGTHSIGNL